jgi:peptide/nickel transport system substrate-binding protein
VIPAAGTLRVAMGDDLTVSDDAHAKAYEVIVWGLGETLTRLSPAGRLEPWLARRVEMVDPLTWRVGLRHGARFWDGTPVSSTALAESFASGWEVQPDVASLISPSTEVRPLDATTLEFRTPEVIGNFPNALSYPQFVVNREGGKVMTGPYRPVVSEPGRSLVLEAFDQHWAGPPALGRVEIEAVEDPLERLDALREGRCDLAYGLLPETLDRLGPEFEVSSVPSKKLHFIQLNHARPPFDDLVVRQAVSLAVDRSRLVQQVMHGQGAVAQSLFPPYGGVATVAAQRIDVEAARCLLHRTGWRPGSDAVLARGGRRLAFTLYSFPQRREMSALAHLVAEDLGRVGISAAVHEVPNIVAQTRDGVFEAAMRSINTLVTGDPYFLLQAMFAPGGRTNTGRYRNPDVDAQLAELRTELDARRRQELSTGIQEITAADAANVYLLFTPIILAYRRGGLQNFEPDFNNEYIVKHRLSVGGPASARSTLTADKEQVS